MSEFQPTVQDFSFLLFDVFGFHNDWPELYPELGLDQDTAGAALEEAARLIQSEIAPLLTTGDAVGAQWQPDGVTTPPGYPAAFQRYREGGWTALTGNPNYGGMGMPKVLAIAIEEMLYGGDSAFALYPGLTAGACLLLEAHASEPLKERFLPLMYSGEWAGTMCLTEPQAGSDLGMIQTRAEPNGDDTYQLQGTKIFITGGDQDLTDNIIHLVLARLPDAPAGPAGISLFAVPKYWIEADGSLGAANGVSCGSIESKMGLKASATCVMHFDAARGYLIGEPNRGLNCMFTMMNSERLSIGVQGLGCGERSYQNARAYASERIQGKGHQRLLDHADVRRMLLNMKATTEGGRALATYIGAHLDRAKHAPDPAERQRAEDRVALLTPLAKAFFTDLGLENTVTGQQIFGGHGYTKEYAQEQLVRDVRISQIYEGTNGIQALDLLQRKIFGSKGRLLDDFLTEIEAWLPHCSGELTLLRARFERGLKQFRETHATLMDRGWHEPAELGGAAVEYLHALGYITYAYLWLRQLEVAQRQPELPFNAAKLATGRFYFARILPRLDGLLACIEQGSESMTDFDEAYF